MEELLAISLHVYFQQTLHFLWIEGQYTLGEKKNWYAFHMQIYHIADVIWQKLCAVNN